MNIDRLNRKISRLSRRTPRTNRGSGPTREMNDQEFRQAISAVVSQVSSLGETDLEIVMALVREYKSKNGGRKW